MTRFFYTLMHTLIARSFVFVALGGSLCGTLNFARADDGPTISEEDRKFLISQLVDQLKSGSGLTDPGARLAAMSGAADYFEKIGDREAADAQIKNAAFHLLTSNHLEFVNERDEAAQLMRQVELLSDHNSSPEVQDYVTKWKREVASRALNENVIVDGNSMGNWNSLVSTLASNSEFDDLFQATLKNTAQSGPLTLDQALALETYIARQKIKHAAAEPGCEEQIANSEPQLDPELLKDYAEVAMQLIDPKQENLGAVVPLVWSLRSLISPDKTEEFDKKVAVFWKAYHDSLPQQTNVLSEEERQKIFQEQNERMAHDTKMLNSYTREMTACMKAAPVENQGGCWAVFADSVALLSDPAEQMVHSGGALVMRDDPQDRARGVIVLENAIDVENADRKKNPGKVNDFYGMGMDYFAQNEMAFAEPLGILARHDPQKALELANRLDDEKARVAARSSILMHMTETDYEKKEVKALESETYSNQENESMEQIEELFSHPEQQNQDQQNQDNQAPTPQVSGLPQLPGGGLGFPMGLRGMGSYQ